MCIEIAKSCGIVQLSKAKNDGNTEKLIVGPYSQPKVVSALQYLGTLPGAGVVRVNDYTIRTCRSRNYFSIKHPKNGVLFIPKSELGSTITKFANLV